MAACGWAACFSCAEAGHPAINGVEIEADQDGLADITLAVASSRASKAEVAAFFRGLVG